MWDSRRDWIYGKEAWVDAKAGALKVFARAAEK